MCNRYAIYQGYILSKIFRTILWGECRMEYRKLIKFGNSSYVVSVPKDWLRKNNLEKGDMVYLNENGNNEIILSPQIQSTEPESPVLNLDVDTYDLLEINRRVVSKYVAGCDTFIITGEKTLREKQTDIRNLLNSLMALEIIEQTKSKIVAKDFLNPFEISFKVIVRRIDTILRSMFDDIKSLSSSDDSQDLVKRDYDINRLTHLSTRTIKKCLAYPPLAKKLEVNVADLFYYNELINYLERIGDEIKRISRLIVAPSFPSRHVMLYIKTYGKIHQLYLDTMKALYSGDENSAYELVKQREPILEEINSHILNMKSPQVFSAFEHLKAITVFIRNIVRLIYEVK